MKIFTKRDLVVLDVVRAGYARSQEICRQRGYEKEELHGITIGRYYVYCDETRASVLVKSRVGTDKEEEVVFLELAADGRWTPRAVECYDGVLHFDISIENGQIVFGEGRDQ